MNASNLSVVILHGAYLYGKMMNRPSNDCEDARQVWEDYAYCYNPILVACMRQLQARAFDFAQLDLSM